MVKPRHGANSVGIHIWSDPAQSGEAVLESVEAVRKTHDRTWDKECWQLSQVPRGVVVQPLYQRSMPVAGAVSNTSQHLDLLPLELRVLVVFGVVVGASLTAYPFELWVRSDGAIHRWQPEDLKRHAVQGSQKHGRPLPQQSFDALQSALRNGWGRICVSSERLVRAAGLDELRVDWLLGDSSWGPRIGELTYMGSGSAISVPALSEELTDLFARRHLHRMSVRT